MSIAALQELQTELRRVAIAGSALAKDDFRLKKLEEPLRASAKKAPVFGKVADQIEALTTASADASPVALMDLATLTQSILATQGKTEVDGPGFEPLEPIETGLRSRQVPAKVLRPIIEALTTSGSGRLEVIRSAIVGGHFEDLRLVGPAINALADPYPEIVDLVTKRVLPRYGEMIAPAIESQIDLGGGIADGRRLRVLGDLSGTHRRALYERALESESKEIRAAAVHCLANDPTALDLILQAGTDLAMDVRAEVFAAIADNTDDRAIDLLIKAVTGRDLPRVLHIAQRHQSERIQATVARGAATRLESIASTSQPPPASTLEKIEMLLDCMTGHDSPHTIQFLDSAVDQLPTLKKKAEPRVIDQLCNLICSAGSDSARDTLRDASAVHSFPVIYGIAIDFRRQSPEMFFDKYSRVLGRLKQGRACRERDALEHIIRRQAYRLTSRPLNTCASRLHDHHESMIGFGFSYWTGDEWLAPVDGFDPRWLDVAIAANRPEIVAALARPSHDACVDYLTSDGWQSDRKAVDTPEDAKLIALVGLMRAGHPAADDHYFELIQDDVQHMNAWAVRFTVGLRAEARSRLDELLPTLPSHIANGIAETLRHQHQQQQTQ